MKLNGIAVLALGIALALSGCAGATGVASPTSSPVADTPTATPTPTPTVMSLAEASAKYLAVVCPTNAAKAAANDAVQKQNLTLIQQTAASARDASRAEAVAFTDPLWPDAVKPEMKTLSDSDFGSVASLDELARATTLDQANAVVFTDNGAAAAAQKVRAILGLPADTSASCK